MASIKISLVGDVRSFVASFKKGKESVEDIADELDDLAKEGDQTERAFVDNFQAIEKAAKEAQTASGKIGDGTRDATRKAAASTGEFKDEAKQNFSEVASSFSGDMSSAADLVQGTLGGLAGSLGGPLGLALGAASIAIGAFIADAQKAAERAEELRLEAVDAVQNALDAGVDPQVFLSSADQVIERIQELEKQKSTKARWFWEEDPSQLEEWSDAMRALGRPTEDIQKVMSNPAALRAYTDAVDRQTEALTDEYNAAVLLHSQETSASSLAGQEAARKKLDASKDISKYLHEEIDLRGLAEDSANRQADAGIDAAVAMAEAAEAEAEKIGEISSAWQDAAVDAADYWVTNEEGVSSFDWGAYLADAEATLTASNEFKRQIVTLPADIATEAQAVFAAQGAGAANAYITAYQNASTGDKERFSSAARTNSEAAGTAAAEGIVAGFGAPVLTPTVQAPNLTPAQTAIGIFNTSVANLTKPKTTLAVDTAPAATAVKKITDAKYDVKITAKPDTSSFSSVSTQLNTLTHDRSVTITPSTSTTGIDTQLRNYRPPTVYVPAVLVKPGTRQPI